MKDAAQPKISIVVATYNCASVLEACIDSIRHQTYQNIELVVVDGASTDDTLNILKKYSGLLKTLVSEPDNGVYDAWNKALKFVTGEWVYFIGADDRLASVQALSTVCGALTEVPEGTLIAYGQVCYVVNGKREQRGRPWEACETLFRSEMCIPHQAVFHSRKLFELYGGFDSTLKVAGDYKMVMQSLLHSRPYFMDGVLVAEQFSGGMSSLRMNRLSTLLEFRSVQRQLGYPITARWVWNLTKGLGWKVVSLFWDPGA